MPIHLPPISRRQFLARSLTASAGLLLSPNLFAASRKVDENTWALFSDTHVAADPAHIARTVNMTANLKAVAKEVIDLPKRPAAVLISGDLAFNHGEKGDYENFTSLLAPLRKAQMPVHLALGNHDHRATFWDAVKHEKTITRPVVDREVAILRSPRANWFVLDSLDKTLSTPGLLGETQLAWLGKSLDGNADKPAIVVVHHNPDRGQNKGSLLDSKALLEIVRARKQVKALIFGHTHHWGIQQDESGIHMINLPPTAYPFDSTSPNGWVLAKLEKDGLGLELRALDKAHKEHGRVVDLKWRA